MTARLLTMLAAVVALAACSAPDEQEPQATPISAPATTTTAMTTTEPTPSEPSLPAINRPLDASTYRARVCDLLTEAQIRRLDMGSVDPLPEQPDQSGRVTCLIHGPIHEGGTRTSLMVTYYYATDLLAAIYRRELPGSQPYQPLTPVSVAGQPAWQAELGDDCQLAVGLADTQGVEISFGYTDLPLDRDPCGQAMEVGENIVRNLVG
jgi:hypothetical protein